MKMRDEPDRISAANISIFKNPIKFLSGEILTCIDFFRQSLRELTIFALPPAPIFILNRAGNYTYKSLQSSKKIIKNQSFPIRPSCIRNYIQGKTLSYNGLICSGKTRPIHCFILSDKHQEYNYRQSHNHCNKNLTIDKLLIICIIEHKNISHYRFFIKNVIKKFGDTEKSSTFAFGY